MTIKRLRQKYTDEQLAQIYATPHDHTKWGRGHGERVNKMIELGRMFQPYDKVADLSCGNAYVIDHIEATHRIRGDYAPGYEYTGPLENTITEMPDLDLYICGETLEHLHDPMESLAWIASVSSRLLLSTPINAWEDGTAEHYWAWDRDGVERMMRDAGFTMLDAFEMVDSRLYNEPYCYGIWMVH